MRLLTRSDFDGLVCAALLEEAEVIDSYKFVHPKDVQDGIIQVSGNDVLANIPYLAGCGLWFDHHSSEQERLRLMEKYSFKGESRPAPSCARVIYDYYDGPKVFSRFDDIGLMAAVDKSDSGQLTRKDIESPEGWILLSFIMDPRTGMGRYRDYRISNYHLMESLIKFCRTMTVEEILAQADVKERVDRYREQEKAYEEMIRTNSRMEENVLIIDLHEVSRVVSGNRFKEYVLFPKANVSIRILWGFMKQNMVFTVGKSILNRTSNADVGSLMLQYGGGGHKAVGTCQVPVKDWQKCLDEVVYALKDSTSNDIVSMSMRGDTLKD